MNPYGYKVHLSSREMMVQNQSSILNVRSLVLLPALSALDAETARLQMDAESGETLPSLSVRFQEFNRRELTISFCLVIQSVWERQFRSFLGALSHEITDKTLEKLATDNKWEQAFKHFQQICTSKLGRLPPGTDDLTLLHYLGNACRHGAGDSLKKVHKLRPDLWPEGVGQSPTSTLSMFGLCIPDALLIHFIGAISSFWEWLLIHSSPQTLKDGGTASNGDAL